MNAVSGAPHQLGKWVLRAWDQASIYLPLVLMAALALGTYWLARHSPISPVPEPVKTVTHEIDYFMRQFTIRSFDEVGLLKSEVNGAEARHYADTDILEIDQPRIRSIGDQGGVIVSSGTMALSNGDGSEVQLIGNARVVREAVKAPSGKLTPRMEFAGEFLHAFVKEERVNSHKPVVLTRGADQFSGDTFSYDSITGVVELKGRVKGVLTPKSATASAGSASKKGSP